MGSNNPHWLFNNECHIERLSTELEAIDDPSKRLIESLNTFNALRTECYDMTNKLSDCHKAFGDVVGTSKSFDWYIKDNSNIKIVLAGPTHSGKSTLINTLLSCQLMPSSGGHTSGRICILAHSTTIRIKFFKVIPHQDQDHPSRLECIDDETITIENQRQLQTTLKQHLSRPAGIDNEADPLTFKEWASKIVRVEFPSPLLRTGLEIIDVPGFSISDHASLFSIRKQFFNVYQPTGIMFCYSNTAFSDGEVLAMPDLIHSLPSDHNDSMLFVNTKRSKSEVALNNNIDQGDEIPLELINSYTDICFSKVEKSIPNASKRRFSIVNALDFIKQPKSVGTRYMFNQFIDQLIKWIAKIFQQQGHTLLRMIELECKSMWKVGDSLKFKLGHDCDIDTLKRDTFDVLNQYANDVSVSVNRIVDTIPVRFMEVLGLKSTKNSSSRRLSIS
ncbi:hypothetical protein SAMD00019534_114490 [Acytostelium subglobosum LB1]|uniref:hypothetical protein n=1 Tax=Acytostelium subglobosum LB1 TaxID=1410327 RepID=UPI000645153D|nr:hypothetical protein SAMD00019534_114490 [Acytostelium subglobosum LB1]GAM28273.1 hypothetical protein SAMD00019534_114490 [Acytostelium subglobosum LB1]|eukprot:XP_012748907.1 hypothetical protein SAMD00019534_114490 [Acytostelium subglobosum LB1]